MNHTAQSPRKVALVIKRAYFAQNRAPQVYTTITRSWCALRGSLFLAISLFALFFVRFEPLARAIRCPRPSRFPTCFPREVEVGDRLEIVGIGFARRAQSTRHVSRRFEPAPARPRECTTRRSSRKETSPHRIASRFRTPTSSKPNLAAPEMRRCTRRSTAQSRSRSPLLFVGAPPVAATLQRASIDFFVRRFAQSLECSCRKPSASSHFPGIHILDGSTRTPRLSIAAVDSGSRAEAAEPARTATTSFSVQWRSRAFGFGHRRDRWKAHLSARIGVRASRRRHDHRTLANFRRISPRTHRRSVFALVLLLAFVVGIFLIVRLSHRCRACSWRLRGDFPCVAIPSHAHRSRDGLEITVFQRASRPSSSCSSRSRVLSTRSAFAPTHLPFSAASHFSRRSSRSHREAFATQLESSHGSSLSALAVAGVVVLSGCLRARRRNRIDSRRAGPAP